MAPVLDLARRLGATPTMVLLALWGVLLSRWSGQREVMVGMPVDLRRGRETEGLIGFFVNTVVVRLELGDDPPLVRLIERVREAVLSAHEHQELPYERVVEAVGAGGRGGSLFQAAFEVQGAGVVGRRLGEVGLELLEIDTGTAKFEVTLFVREGAAGGPWRATVEWSAARFAAATAELWLSQYAALVSAAGASPEQPVGSLGLWGPGERERVVGEWSGARVPWQPSPAGVDELVWRQAAAEPAAVAVEDGRGVVRYGELTARAAELASRLAGLGVGRGERVGLAVERGAALVVAMLGVVRSGAAYVPLDEASPAERLSWVLSDTGARVVVRGAGWSGAAESLAGRQVVELSADGSPAAPGPAAPVAVRTAGADLAYVLYTSGSTGRPKGVAVPHRAIARLAVGTDYVRLGRADRVAQAASAAFDAATFEVWGALLTGGRVVTVPREVTLSPRDLVALLRRRRVTTLFLTTALFDQVAREAPDGLAGLETVLFGGEAVDPERVRAVLAAGGPRRLLHVYGPTETTTFASWQAVRSVERAARTVPIGRGLAGTRLFVVDGAGRPQPPGVPGELWIGGDGVAWGYLGRPAATAERFVPDALSDEPGGRLYRSGDTVRWRGDGELEFLGRRDGQVKLRGFRVELGEVEAAIRSAPGVAAAAAAVHRAADGPARLVGYAVPADGALSVEAVREHVAARLPEFMVPSALVALASLPLNVNGKLDRRALPPPAAAPATAGRPPSGALERQVAAVWREVLGQEPAGADDDFFELGGHSLLATQVASRLRRQLSVEVPLRTVFEEPTVARLAAAVDRLLAVGRPPLPPITPTDRSKPLPLSFGQRRLWLLDQIEGLRPSYNVPMAVRAEGPLRPAVLHQTLIELVRRHEILRTRFAAGEDEPVQIVLPPGEAATPMPCVDLRRLATADRRGEAARLAREDARRPFGLDRPPLLRVRLVRLEEREHVIAATLHHVVTDGWSLDVLRREVAVIYAGLLGGGPSPLPEPALQYGDYAAWQRQVFGEGRLEADLEFWRRCLAGAAPRLRLPTDRARPAVRSERGGRCAVRLPAAAAGVRRLACRLAATEFMVLIGLYQALLTRWTGERDLCVGTPIAGRDQVEVEPLVGFFVNTLVIRASVDPGGGLAAHLASLRPTVLGAFLHRHVPFERLVEELAPRRLAAEAPLVQTIFTVQRRPGPLEVVPGLRLSELDETTGSAKLDLILTVEMAEDEVEVRLVYDRDLFDPTTPQRILGHYAALMAAAVAEPERPLGRLPMLSPAERQQLLHEWNDTAERAPALGPRDRPAARGPGPQVARRAGRGRGGGGAELRRAQPPGEPAGPPPPAPRRRPRGAGGGLPGALPRPGDRPPRRAQGRRRVPAARPVAAAGAARAPAGGRPARRPGRPPRPGRRGRRGVGSREALPLAGRPAGGGGRPGGRRRGPAVRRRARRPRLRHLHLGLDRPAEGGRGEPPGAAPPDRLAPAGVRADAAGPGDAGRPDRLRRLGLGDLALPGRRRQPPWCRPKRGPDPRRRWSGLVRRDRGVDGHLRLRSLATAPRRCSTCRPGRFTRVDPGAGRRRGDRRGAVDAARADVGDPVLQSLRTDGDHGQRDDPACRRSAAAARPAAARGPHRPRRAGRRTGAGPAWSASCGSAARSVPRLSGAVAGSTAERFLPDPYGGFRAAGSTAPATWPLRRRRGARSSSSVAPTTR
jgi:amino acid adenylation domain-containing protein